MIATALSDAELLEQARAGDESAFTELYVRHQAAALRLANSYRRAGDPDDLVNGAFERVLGALRRGAGPTESFRAYLFVTLRRLAQENIARSKDDPFEEVPEPVRAEAGSPELDRADRAIVMQAYESLPDRWQAVLWQTMVEGRSPREIAPMLGMSANATAALAYRAREKLRQAYLQAHLQARPRPECEPHRSRLGAYVREGLSQRNRGTTEQHLDGCGNCRELLAELVDVNAVLSQTMLPVFLAASADVTAVAVGAGAGGLLSGPVAWVHRGVSKARNNPTGSAVVAGALLAAILAAGLIANGGGEETPPEAAAGPPEEASDPPSEPSEPSDSPSEPADSPPPAPSPSPSPAPDTPPAEQASPPTEPADSPPPSPPPSDQPGPPGTSPPSTPPPTEPPSTSPPTTAPPTTPPPPPAPVGPVIWNTSARTVDVTLTNSGSVSTDYMLLNVTLSGGAVIRGAPSGCDLTLALVVTAECGINPIPAGSTEVVRLPVAVTAPGQRATAWQCTVGLLRLQCDSPILRTTTVPLE